LKGEDIPKIGELHLTLTERVYREIRAAIFQHRLAPGRPLRSEQLAELMGVSRTPVKEALSMLRVEGLVVYSDRRGFSVIERTPEYLPDIYEAMMMIEVDALENGLRAASENAVGNIHAAHERFAAACAEPERDTQLVYDEAYKFHRSIAALGESPLALDWYDTLEAERQGLRLEALPNYDIKSLQVLVSQHKAVQQAIDDRDVGLAKRLLIEHLSEAIKVAARWVDTARAAKKDQPLHPGLRRFD
jgi:DNA-binding GntR family transcriptional regulator